MKFPYFLLLLFVLVSCKSVEPTTLLNTTQDYSTSTQTTVDTVVVHDSVYVREVMRGDTVYLTRTEYRDRWRIREVHDTIHNTQYITQTIEHPPEKYVPKFYKWTTALLFILLFILGVRIYIKLKG